MRFTEIRGYVEQAFAPQAEEKGLRFEVELLDKDTMKGKLVIEGLGEGIFTGKKQ